MAGNDGGLPLERKLGISKICGVFPGLAGIEGVACRKGWGCIAEFRAASDDPTAFLFHGVFLWFLGGCVFHFGAFCGAILAFKKGPNGSSGPSWRILDASWALVGHSSTKKRFNKMNMVLLAWKRIPSNLIEY